MNIDMSVPGDTAKIGITHSNIQTGQTCPFLAGFEPSMH